MTKKTKKLVSILLILMFLLVLAEIIYRNSTNNSVNNSVNLSINQKTFDFSGVVKLKIKHKEITGIENFAGSMSSSQSENPSEMKIEDDNSNSSNNVPAQKTEIKESSFNYNIEGSVVMPNNYSLKISDNKGAFYESSVIDGKKYIKLLNNRMLSNTSNKLGLSSINYWKEIDSNLLINKQKIDKYNFSLIFNSVGYLINFNNPKLEKSNDKHLHYKESYNMSEEDSLIINLLQQFTYREIGDIEIEREILVDKKSGLWNSEKIIIKALDNREDELASIEVSVNFSNFDKEIDLLSMTKIDEVVKNNNLRKSVNSENKYDLRNKRSLYIIAKGLKRFYDKNNEYPKQNLMNINNQNSVLLDLTPLYFLENNLKDARGSYYPAYQSNGNSYQLSVILENKEDKWCTLEENNCVYRIKNGIAVSEK